MNAERKQIKKIILYISTFNYQLKLDLKK